MKPTPEQTACVEAFQTGKALRVNAYAGTGKTTTLVSMADATTRRGVYLAFNKSIATDAARKFPRHVSCSTVHAMAFRAMRGAYDVDKMTGQISAGFRAGWRLSEVRSMLRSYLNRKGLYGSSESTISLPI